MCRATTPRRGPTRSARASSTRTAPPVTSKDVKYAVARSLDKATLPSGPTYFNDFLLDVPEGYSVYKDKTLAGVAKAIETPDDEHHRLPPEEAVLGFDYFAQLPSTAPVPQAKDTGAKYKEHPFSTGPYKFETYDANKGFDLVRNDELRPVHRPGHGPQGAAGQDHHRLQRRTAPTSTTG